MNTIFETNFTVFPEDTNYMPPMIFGGKLMSEMDIAAAMAVRRLLYDSPTLARDAVTVAVSNIEFHVGAVVKDLIYLKAEVVSGGVKSIDVHVDGWRERHDGREKICNGDFRFVAYDLENKIAIPHGLIIPRVYRPVFGRDRGD